MTHLISMPATRPSLAASIAKRAAALILIKTVRICLPLPNPSHPLGFSLRRSGHDAKTRNELGAASLEADIGIAAICGLGSCIRGLKQGQPLQGEPRTSGTATIARRAAGEARLNEVSQG
jgi:hypothetical protein